MKSALTVAIVDRSMMVNNLPVPVLANPQNSSSGRSPVTVTATTAWSERLKRTSRAVLVSSQTSPSSRARPTTISPRSIAVRGLGSPQPTLRPATQRPATARASRLVHHRRLIPWLTCTDDGAARPAGLKACSPTMDKQQRNPFPGLETKHGHPYADDIIELAVESREKAKPKRFHPCRLLKTFRH